MENHDSIQLSGLVRVRLIRNGLLVWEKIARNLVMQVGKNLAADIFVQNDGSPATPTYMALGDGGAAVADAQTALDGTEHMRNLASLTRVANDVTWTVTFVGLASPVMVREMGIFNASGIGTGTMFARMLTQEFQLFLGDSVNVDWRLSFGGIPEGF